MINVSEFLCTLEPSEIIDLRLGEYLFHQNDPARGMYLVREGRIKLIRDSIDGNTVIMFIAQENDSLAEASLFSSHYHCHAKSDAQSKIFFYEKDNILAHFSSDSASALNFIEVLAKQLQRLRLLFELRGIRPPRERFIQYLRIMVDTDRSLVIASTYKDLAITLGMTHETLYRVLGQLEKDKVIGRTENRVVLHI